MRERFVPYYLYRRVKFMLGDKSPLACVLKITSRCNLRCSHCPWWKETKEDLPKEKWLEIIDYAREQGCVLCIIEGGEPLLREDLNSVIEYAKKRMFVSVITNGTVDFSRISPDAVWVSVDGVGKTYEKIRGIDFEKVLENVEKNANKHIIILMSISKSNIGDIEKVCEVFSPITKGIWFNFVYPYEGIQDIALNAEERRNVAERILKLKTRYKIINSESFLKSVGKEWKCRPWLTLNVSSCGRLHHGCTVEQIEECRCEECDMSCYGEMSQAYGMKMDAVDFLKKSLGLETEKIIFLRNKG